jgi:hypothetical protein
MPVDTLAAWREGHQSNLVPASGIQAEGNALEVGSISRMTQQSECTRVVGTGSRVLWCRSIRGSSHAILLISPDRTVYEALSGLGHRPPHIRRSPRSASIAVGTM